MKLRISAVTYTDDTTRVLRDITLTVDVTATVGEVARGLVRGGAGHTRLLPIATHRLAPLTLRVAYPTGAELILDASDTIGMAGLQPGSAVEPVFEAEEPGGRNGCQLRSPTFRC